jgi:hypothetical protein
MIRICPQKWASAEDLLSLITKVVMPGVSVNRLFTMFDELSH